MTTDQKDREGNFYPALDSPDAYYEAVAIAHRLRGLNPDPQGPVGITLTTLKADIIEFEMRHYPAFQEWGDWDGQGIDCEPLI